MTDRSPIGKIAAQVCTTTDKLAGDLKARPNFQGSLAHINADSPSFHRNAEALAARSRRQASHQMDFDNALDVLEVDDQYCRKRHQRCASEHFPDPAVRRFIGTN
jgi:hypothetical protein